MRGRKPKYSQEEINEIASRLAAGESESDIAHEKNMPRTSVLRCGDSARLTPSDRNQIKQVASEKKTLERDRLFWRFVEVYLRQAIKKAPEAMPKEIAVILEAAVKIRALTASAPATQRGLLIRATDETVTIFERAIQGKRVQIAGAIQSPQTDLGRPNPDVLQTAARASEASVEEPQGGA